LSSSSEAQTDLLKLPMDDLHLQFRLVCIQNLNRVTNQRILWINVSFLWMSGIHGAFPIRVRTMTESNPSNLMDT
jgi:hypothetical protein